MVFSVKSNEAVNKENIRNHFLAYLAFCFLLFGAKLWLIFNYGNATPYWDQWDAEAANLYAPFLEGKLHWYNLFAAHNEHRIFTTRVLALIELTLNGAWNPLLQMLINAAVHTGILLFIIRLLLGRLNHQYTYYVLIFSLVLFALPCGFENTLSGFQIQFYFVIFFSILSLWLLLRHEPLTWMWWFGFGTSVLGFFSLASGSFAMLSAAVISALFFVFGIRRSVRQLLAILILLGTFLVCVKFTPVLAVHAVLRAHSIPAFFNALIAIMGWPIGTNIFSALIMYFPSITLILVTLIQLPRPTHKRWFILSLVLWGVIGAMGIAYGRNELPLASRYLDLYSISVLVNLVCFLELLRKFSIRSSKVNLTHLLFICVFVWSFMVLALVSIYQLPDLQDFPAKREIKMVQEENTRNYLKSHDITALKKVSSHSTIPYPDPERLAMLLDTPSIRSILPSNIAPSKTMRVGRFDNVVSLILKNYVVFLIVGGILSALTLLLILGYQKNVLPTANLPKE